MRTPGGRPRSRAASTTRPGKLRQAQPGICIFMVLLPWLGNRPHSRRQDRALSPLAEGAPPEFVYLHQQRVNPSCGAARSRPAPSRWRRCGSPAPTGSCATGTAISSIDEAREVSRQRSNFPNPSGQTVEHPTDQTGTFLLTMESHGNFRKRLLLRPGLYSPSWQQSR